MSRWYLSLGERLLKAKPSHFNLRLLSNEILSAIVKEERKCLAVGMDAVSFLIAPYTSREYYLSAW